MFFHILENYSGISYLDNHGNDKNYKGHFEIIAKLLNLDIEEFKKAFPDLENSKIDMQKFKRWCRLYVTKDAKLIVTGLADEKRKRS
jgi:hypothetical protein